MLGKGSAEEMSSHRGTGAALPDSFSSEVEAIYRRGSWPGSEQPKTHCASSGVPVSIGCHHWEGLT